MRTAERPADNLPRLAKVFSSVPNAHFVFAVGTFEDSTGLLEGCRDICRQHNIQDRVHFLGKRSDISNILHSLDVYVHSSVNESQGIAVVEAMLAGSPVIVSDIGALLEVTNNGDCALVFRTGDAEHLADQLLKLAQDEPCAWSGRQELRVSPQAALPLMHISKICLRSTRTFPQLTHNLDRLHYKQSAPIDGNARSAFTGRTGCV